MENKKSGKKPLLGLSIGTLDEFFEKTSADNIEVFIGKIKKGDKYNTISKMREYEIISLRNKHYLLVNGTDMLLCVGIRDYQ